MNYDEAVMWTIEAALADGGKMHAFLSGGGLRVIRIEKPQGNLVAYGEHPHVGEAFRITAEDYKAGGRPYKEVYGNVEPHHETGDSCSEDELDKWVCRGCTFDAHCKDGNFVFELRGQEHFTLPTGMEERVFRQGPVEFTDARGVVFVSSPARFPNGEKCCRTRAIRKPEGMREDQVWSWSSVRRGEGGSLMEAMRGAFAASPTLG